MIGISWTEMLLIGVFALIFIGPKELPALMQRLGKAVGAIRRMSNDFRREINKTTGLDQITDLRRSITEPLKKTSAEIAREFNVMTPSGAQPSGKIKPADPSAESVVAEIEGAAGIAKPQTFPLTREAAMKQAVQNAVAAKAPVKTGAATDVPATDTPAAEAAPAKPSAPRKLKAAPPPAMSPPAVPPKSVAPSAPKPRPAAPKPAATGSVATKAAAPASKPTPAPTPKSATPEPAAPKAAAKRKPASAAKTPAGKS